jgi:hypothetical protein
MAEFNVLGQHQGKRWICGVRMEDGISNGQGPMILLDDSVTCFTHPWTLSMAMLPTTLEVQTFVPEIEEGPFAFAQHHMCQFDASLVPKM